MDTLVICRVYVPVKADTSIYDRMEHIRRCHTCSALIRIDEIQGWP